MNLNKKRFLTTCFACIIFIACKNNKPIETEVATERAIIPVTIVQPTTQGFTDFIQLNGNTQFQKKLTIRATITGYLSSLKWQIGDHIKNGNLFCNIKTKEQEALKNVDSKEPSLKPFQVPLNVFANTSGIFTAVNYSQGDFVNEGDVLATITDPASMVLVINVPYEYHQLVYKGKDCLVKFPDGKIINATVQQEVPYVDVSSQTQSFLIHFPGNQLLPENMNLIVRIPTNQKQNAIALPLDAIQTNETQDEFWVMKLVNNSLAIRVPIKVGIQKDSLKEIISGVNIDDKIIVNGAYGLSDSAAVKVVK